MNYKKNMEGCQMSSSKNVKIDDIKSQLYAKAFMAGQIIQ